MSRWFVVDGEDVIMFRAAESVGEYLEPRDIRPGEDTIFLDDGTIYRLSVANDRVGVSEEVLGSDPVALAQALHRYLAARRGVQAAPPIDKGELPHQVEAFASRERAW